MIMKIFFDGLTQGQERQKRVVLDSMHLCCSVAQSVIQVFSSLFTVLHQQPQ